MEANPVESNDGSSEYREVAERANHLKEVLEERLAELEDGGADSPVADREHDALNQDLAKLEDVMKIEGDKDSITEDVKTAGRSSGVVMRSGAESLLEAKATLEELEEKYAHLSE